MEDLHERGEERGVERGVDGHGGGSGAIVGNGYSMVDAPESAFAVDHASPSGVGGGAEGEGEGSLVGMYVRIFWHDGFRDAIETYRPNFKAVPLDACLGSGGVGGGDGSTGGGGEGGEGGRSTIVPLSAFLRHLEGNGVI